MATTVVTRYGATEGHYASPAGTLFSDRALPSSYARMPLNRYEVVKPVSVHESIIRPWFNQSGMGTQWRFKNSIQYYLDNDYLRVLP